MTLKRIKIDESNIPMMFRIITQEFLLSHEEFNVRVEKLFQWSKKAYL